MKLVPTAKPVKIRIMAGGEEHKSLDSLSRCFVWSDIQKLLRDGILIKWLKRFDDLEKGDKALKLEQLSDDEKNPIQVYNILFGESITFYRDADVFSSLRMTDAHESLAKSLLSMKTAEELLELSDTYRELKLHIPAFLGEKAKKFSEATPGQTMFRTGKFLVQFPRYKETGIECILSAAKRGLREAQDFKRKELVNRQNDQKSLRSEIFKRLQLTETKNIIGKSWEQHVYIPLNTNDMALKLLYEFSNHCRSIAITAIAGPGVQEKAEKYFEKVSVGDPLYREKKFILALFTIGQQKALDRMECIPNYPPAKMILQNYSIGKGCIVDLCGKTFWLSTTQTGLQQNASVLQFFLLNLHKIANS